MNQITIQAAQSLFEAAWRIGFIDPVTGEGPNSEEHLIALLAYFHQTGRIHWQAVPAVDVTSLRMTVRASEVISGSDVALTGYHVIAQSQNPVDASGKIKMPTSLLFLSRDERRAVLLQSKIGSSLALSTEPRNSQLSYFRTLGLPDRRFILLSSGRLLDRGWYFTEVSEALRVGSRTSVVRGYIMRWEAVLAAITPAQHAAGAGH